MYQYNFITLLPLKKKKKKYLHFSICFIFSVVCFLRLLKVSQDFYWKTSTIISFFVHLILESNAVGRLQSGLTKKMLQFLQEELFFSMLIHSSLRGSVQSIVKDILLFVNNQILLLFYFFFYSRSVQVDLLIFENSKHLID